MHRNILASQWFSLIFWVGICILVQVIASLLTFVSVNNWYTTLEKPSWTPPGWMFGPVWTFLYTCMGVAAWLVWRRRQSVKIKPALIVFGIQLLLNGLWPGLFFTLKNIEAALIEIILLWISILITMILFWKIHRMAGGILVPYLIWVSYAASLNFSIWRLNP